MRPHPRRLGALVLALAPFLGACSSDPTQGYALESAYRDDIATIAVPVFGNTTFAHGLETQLTDAIVKEVHRATPWRVTAAAKADTELTGSITGADLRTLTRDSDTGLVQSQAVQLTVAFEWKDLDSGRVLVSRRNYRAAEIFVPARDANQRIQTGQNAAIDELARDIVAALRSSW